jgi:hypothetical protein
MKYLSPLVRRRAEFFPFRVLRSVVADVAKLRRSTLYEEPLPPFVGHRQKHLSSASSSDFDVALLDARNAL